MFVIMNQSGDWLTREGKWAKDKAIARRFHRYVDAFNARPAGGRVIEL
jgi:hypothetical protein